MNLNQRDSFESTNTIYYGNVSGKGLGLYWYHNIPDVENPIAVPMYNGNSYKWVITLYQGDDQGNTPPSPMLGAYKYYDMQLTTGEVMGSYDERIQTRYSDKVYIDYYIQPVQISNLSYNPATPENWSGGTITEVGTRARIKNIDSSYGYIYPQMDETAYPTDTITKGTSNGYRIYQMGNNSENLPTTRKVDMYVSQRHIPFDWNDMASNPSTSHGSITFYVLQNSQSSISVPIGESGSQALSSFGTGGMSATNFDPFSLVAATSEIVGKEDEEGNPTYTSGIRWFYYGSYGAISTESRILLNAQTTNFTEETKETSVKIYNIQEGEITAVSGSTSCAYNGIYTTRFSNEGSVRIRFNEVDEDTREFYQYTVSWDRASDADTWGELINKVVAVTGGSEDVDTNKQTIWEGMEESSQGTLNETPIKFEAERPLTIYEDGNDSDHKTTGLIFYTDEEETITNNSVMYISPFIGIKSGMYWIEKGNTSDTNRRRFTIGEINEDYWFVKFGNADYRFPSSFTSVPVRGTEYVIKSYFRDSDENLFDLYKNPTIDIKIYRDEKHTVPDPKPTLPPEGGEPYFDDTGEYIIEQNYGMSSDIKMTCVDRRTVWCEADYNQADFISWRSFQWFLYDGVGTSGTLLQSSDLTFDGKLGHQFYGLLLNKVYTIVLVLETNSGLTLSQQKYISTNFTTVEVDNFPFDITYECDTHSVYLRFGLSGFILPNVYSDNPQKPRIQNDDGSDTIEPIPGVSYDGENMIIDGTNVDYPSSGVTYGYVCSTLDSDMATTQIQADEDDISFESSHRLEVGDNWGNIVGFDFVNDESDFNSGYESFNIFIPNYNSGSFEYDGEIYSYVDEIRVHQIFFENTVGYLILEATIYDWSGGVISPYGIFDADDNGEVTSPIIVSGHFQAGGEADRYSGGNVVFKDDYPSILITLDNEEEVGTYYTPRENAPHQYRESYFDFLGQDDGTTDAVSPLVSAENIEWMNFLVKTETNDRIHGGPEEDGMHYFKVETSPNSGVWEEFMVMGTGPYIWSDHNLIRKNVSYLGSVTINAQTLEETYDMITYVNRQVEDLESNWVWSDGTYGGTDDVAAGNYIPEFYWVDGDDNGGLDGLYYQTDLASSSQAHLRNSNNINKYTYSIRAVVEGNYSGAPNHTVQIFKQLLEGAD